MNRNPFHAPVHAKAGDCPNRVSLPKLAVGAALALATLSLLLAAPAGAQRRVLRPWTPPGLDSLVAAAAEIKVLFQQAEGDSVTGENFRPYDRVGAMARHLLRDLGKDRALQAYAVKTTLDSLGLDTRMALDPENPEFTLLIVRNPWRLAAPCVAFIYWWRVDDLRMQGALVFGGEAPQMKVWWTGEPAAPYEVGLIDESRSGPPRLHLTVCRMDPRGYYWDLIQYKGHGPDLGGAGSATWTDVNHDGIPELVTWVQTPNDSLFAECSECPKLITESTYTRRKSGFDLLEQRLVPTPYSTFSLFVQLLLSGQKGAAGRLLTNPAKVEAALALGWGRRRAAGTWTLERAEPEERWPRWLGFKFQDGAEKRRFIVRFRQEGVRWLIHDWEEPAAAGRPAGRAPAKAPAKPGDGGRGE